MEKLGQNGERTVCVHSFISFGTCISALDARLAEQNCLNLQGNTVIEKSYKNSFKNKDKVMYNTSQIELDT